MARRRFLSASQMFDRVLIANRGEIACRIIRSARGLGVKTIAVYSDADANAQFVRMADEAHWIGPSPTNESYLLKERIIDTVRRAKAQAVHPGYGFLSENPEFAEMCNQAGAVFIGPPVTAMRSMGSKAAAKQIMTDAGVPVTPAYYGEDQDPHHLMQEASRVGYPVMIKAVTGGGGKGMRRVMREEDFLEALDACKREAIKSFGRDRMLIEKYLVNPRHIELQIFGDNHGNAIHLYERDCSVQRRHQKVLEESPAPGLSDELRQEMGQAAVLAAKAVSYSGAGTVEFLLDPATQQFYFCEMNTRLQVEHPVTEMVTGIDLVEWQLRVAAGQVLPVTDQAQVITRGHALEARIYADNPAKGFLPATGKLKRLRVPEAVEGHIRIESGVVEGDEVSIYYDPMIAKLLTWGSSRPESIRRMLVALRDYQIAGVPNNIGFLQRCIDHPAFQRGGVTTGFLTDHERAVSVPNPAPPSPHLLSLAAYGLLMRRESAKGTSPWTMGAWRLFGSRTLPLTLQLEGLNNAYRLQVVVHGDGGTLTVRTSEGGSYVVSGIRNSNSEEEVSIDGCKYKCDFLIQDGGLRGGARIQIWLRGPSLIDDPPGRHSFQLEVPKVALGLGASAADAPQVLSPMPGKIVKVLVQMGDSVKKGQALLVIEAMKMEHVISATHDAAVEAVAKDVGDVVQEGVVLMQLKG